MMNKIQCVQLKRLIQNLSIYFNCDDWDVYQEIEQDIKTDLKNIKLWISRI